MADLIDRQAVMKEIEKIRQGALMMDDTRRAGIIMNGMQFCEEAVMNQPSAQPEIIHCGECIYYDPPHVEKEDARYEYSEMPKEAFDVLGTGLVSVEYGINVGGRCCVDYYCKNYLDDKRVYVPKDNYCGRAERRTDEAD